MKMNRSFLVLLFALAGMGCGKPLTPWARYYGEMDGKVLTLPLEDAYFRPSANYVGLIGLQQFRFGESRAVYYLTDTITEASALFNLPDQVWDLKIQGEPFASDIGVVYLKANRVFYQLCLNRFYCRALSQQALLLRSTDDQFLFRIEIMKEGFSLDDFENMAIQLNSQDVQRLSISVQKLAYNELKILHKDLSAKQIRNANYNKYQSALIDLLGNFGH
jgi:hypothetical protein